jgi:hypothetical protein
MPRSRVESATRGGHGNAVDVERYMAIMPAMIPRIILPIVLALGFCSLAVTHADAKGGGKAKPRPTPFHITIESVSTDSITVNQPGGVKTYKITKDTEISFKGNTVTADQLQSGMRVEVTPDSVDQGVAGMIQADDPPAPPPVKPAK